MTGKVVEILHQEEIFHSRIFQGLDITFRYTRFDGTMSNAVTHFVLESGRSVCILIHDVPRNEVILVEQVRIATYPAGSGWILELPAGRLDGDEDPRVGAMRETEEETGAVPTQFDPIGSFYLTPGGCSEKIHLYYAPFADGLEVETYGGLANENEDIRIHRIPLAKGLEMIENGDIEDAKTIIAFYWLREKLRSEGATAHRDGPRPGTKGVASH